jgi:thioester reductase-like protein
MYQGLLSQEMYRVDPTHNYDKALDKLTDSNQTSKVMDLSGTKEVKIYIEIKSAPGTQPSFDIQETNENENNYSTITNTGALGQGLHTFYVDKPVYQLRIKEDGSGSNFEAFPTIIASP